MDKNGKIILVIIVILLIAVTGFKYVQFFVNRDFTFVTLVSCDPAIEKCFRISCEDCVLPGVAFSDGSPYKYIELPASHVPQCLEDVTCSDFQCPESDAECITTYCSEDILEEGEECIPLLLAPDITVINQ